MEDKNMNLNHLQEMEMEKERGRENGFGAAIGIVIIVVILIAGGLYFVEKSRIYMEANQTPEEIMAQKDEMTQALSAQGTSDETADIENDLSATNTGGLDAEVGTIERELGV